MTTTTKDSDFRTNDGKLQSARQPASQEVGPFLIERSSNAPKPIFKVEYPYGKS